MASYKCNKCGSHKQFDYVESCVVKIGDDYYKGTYDMYGGVEIAVRLIANENDPTARSNGRRTIMAYTDQFLHKAPVHEESLHATKIYCNGGDDYGSDLNSHVAKAKHLIQSRANILTSPQQPDERNCVPWSVTVLDAVHEGDIPSLPKARELAGKVIEPCDNVTLSSFMHTGH
eukprot:scaffold1736_cov127-Cylindrotheca_fusiformis.AAC.66